MHDTATPHDPGTKLRPVRRRLTSTDAFRRELVAALPDRPFELAFWDGSVVPATRPGGPRFTVRSPAAVSHVLFAPGQLGLGRAYVAGLLDVDDLDRVMPLLGTWNPPTPDTRTRVRLAAAALRAAGPFPPPRPPAAEMPPDGLRHSLVRDRKAVRHHYDVSNDFFRLFLDESMTYSCAIFSRGATTLEEAQRTKLDLVCTKLDLQPGERLLDIGCGWGALALHAAREYGVEVLGITLSKEQAALANERVRDAGLADRIEIRIADYRELDQDGFDAVSSVGMVEHVGAEQMDVYAQQLAAFLKPGGRLLNHGIALLRHDDPPAGPFSERYVFPDGHPLQLSGVLASLERAHLVTEHVEGFAADYAETLRHWYTRLDEHLPEASRLGGEDRLRVWRLYLRAARNGFLNGMTSIYQVRARKPA
jgi:cyclopropane-fatty-acyl-phospholipid synthase